MAVVYQDTITIIGNIEKLDGLRVSRMGVSSFYLVLRLPQEKVIQPIYIPCTIYGNKADELDKKVAKREINVGDMVEGQGSHVNMMRKSRLVLEVKLKSIEKIQILLFGEK